MKGEQKEEVRKAINKTGKEIEKSGGKDVERLSNSLLSEKILPRNALGLSDAMVEGLYSQAYRLYNTGKYKDASQLFRLLIMMDSTEAKFSMGLAACFHMMKEYENAVSTYALCGIIDPESPVPHYHASDCYIQMKDPISAIISLEMAIKRAGDHPEFQSLKDRALMSIESLKKEVKIGEHPKELVQATKRDQPKKKK